jgi:hypothetical protein
MLDAISEKQAALQYTIFFGAFEKCLQMTLPINTQHTSQFSGGTLIFQR